MGKNGEKLKGIKKENSVFQASISHEVLITDN
jgi:hypothetical protein